MGLPLHYEEVAAEHLAFQQSLARKGRLTHLRVLRRRIPLMGSIWDDEENTYRFLRTAGFLSPASCFNSTGRARRCCRRPWAKSQRSCFDSSRPAELCCYKEQHRRSLFAPQGPLYGAAVSRGVADCRALAHLRAADVVDWLEQLLQLPWHLHGPCLTSALARRLAAAPLPRALRALRRLAAAQLGRQALNAARRNLMWWSDKVPLPSSALRLLRNVTLRLRRSDMAPAPVMQLHVAKTAGTMSLCHWANRSGFSSLLPVGLMNRCQLLGDGPFWFGERASPASCPQRLVESPGILGMTLGLGAVNNC
ncbi:unnamed protein product [Cladocopium goreaui]|uniref:Cytochrome P450 704B1 n=1 Tax=Cladocopium goreaui TaxID=2562237 RepID=A0A9P1D5W1_9DINO|nr:unnamed protein product [Cladocopium goreaui]